MDRRHAGPKAPRGRRVEQSPRFVAAFTSLEKAQAFVGQSGDRDWELRLVCRVTFPALAKRLRRYQLRGMCFDPDRRGRGEELELAQIEHWVPGGMHAEQSQAQSTPELCVERKRAAERPASDTLRLCALTSLLLKESSAIRARTIVLHEDLGRQIDEARSVVQKSQQRRKSWNARRCG